jgi:hypothetical protein
MNIQGLKLSEDFLLNPLLEARSVLIPKSYAVASMRRLKTVQFTIHRAQSTLV